MNSVSGTILGGEEGGGVIREFEEHADRVVVDVAVRMNGVHVPGDSVELVRGQNGVMGAEPDRLMWVRNTKRMVQECTGAAE